MNQLLIYSALVGLASIPGICQETSNVSASPEPTPARNSIFQKFLKTPKSADLVPLTREERFRLYLASTYGIGSTVTAATAAGFEQLMNTPGEWKQGSEGYRKRLATAYATHVAQGTIEYGAATLLREDNRYRRSLEAGVWRRTMHAVTGAFSATDEAGHQHFSYSRVSAAGAAAFIRRTWQPNSTAGVSDAIGTFGISLSGQVGGNVFREFWPDIQAHLLKRK
jgi:hypothetical protein